MSNHYKDLKHQHQRLNALDKRGDLSKVIQTFEVYYPKLLKNKGEKGWYRTPGNRLFRDLDDFQDSVMEKHELLKSGQLDAEHAQELTEFFDTLKAETDSLLKKIMRTTILDLYDTMAGDIDNPKFENDLKKVTALTDLYDRIINEDDKKKIREASSNTEIKDFLLNDHNMDGNFSKTLKAFYRKYQNAENEAEKESWKKVCNSYVVRPYTKVISNRVKQEDAYNALPEKEKIKLQQQADLLKEAKTLGQDPKAFSKMSVDERNKIRQEAPVLREIKKLTTELKSEEQHYRIAHQYFANAPERLLSKAAPFQLSEKDSVEFRRMFGALTKLSKTKDFNNMESLMLDGNTADLEKNINLAMKHTQKYIEYASNKPRTKMGFTGRARLNAARETMHELDLMKRAIQEEKQFMMDTKEKRERLENLEAPRKQSLNYNGTEITVAPSRVKMTVAALEGKVDKTAGMKMNDWVIVDHAKAPAKTQEKKKSM